MQIDEDICNKHSTYSDLTVGSPQENTCSPHSPTNLLSCKATKVGQDHLWTFDVFVYPKYIHAQFTLNIFDLQQNPMFMHNTIQQLKQQSVHVQERSFSKRLIQRSKLITSLTINSYAGWKRLTQKQSATEGYSHHLFQASVTESWCQGHLLDHLLPELSATHRSDSECTSHIDSHLPKGCSMPTRITEHKESEWAHCKSRRCR